MILPEHGGESVFQQDYLRGMQYNVYAKALLRLLEIRITHSTHVESVIMMQNCGFKKK